MNSTLREVLDLPEPRTRLVNDQTQVFATAFREILSGVNQRLRQVAAVAGPEDHQLLQAQRTRLCEAFQKTIMVIDPVDPSVCASAFERIKSAASAVEAKAAALVTRTQEARDRWRSREEEFDDAATKIAGLQDASHPKGSALGQVSDAIRDRVRARKFGESLTLFEQLLPKLEKLLAGSQASEGAEEHTTGETTVSVMDRARMWKELEDMERRLEVLLAENSVAA